MSHMTGACVIADAVHTEDLDTFAVELVAIHQLLLPPPP